MVVKCAEILETDDFQEAVIAAEVGRLFREERERRQLSIQDVSKELHIRQLYITSIEEGKLSELPGYVYVVGFIRSYANFLNLNANEMLRQFDLVGQPQVIQLNLCHPIPTNEQQLPSKKVLFGSLTLFFVLALWAYIYNNKVDDVIKDGQDSGVLLSLDAQINNVEQAQVISSNNTIESATPAVGDQVNNIDKIDSTKPESLSSDPAQKNSKGTVSQQENQGKAHFAPVDSKAEKNGENKNSVAPDATAGSASLTSEITILAVKDSWVQVTNGKGRNVYVRLMHAGERYTIPAPSNSSGAEKETFTLNTGNGGGIKLILNGRESRVLGDEGKILRGLALKSEALEKYLP